MIAAALLLATAVASCEPPPTAGVATLLAAQTVVELDAVAPAADAHPALRALYRSRRYALQPDAAEGRRFFRALPRSESELRCVYTLTHPGPHMNAPAVSEAVDAMFLRAARIARQLGTGHDRVLQLALWADGELAPAAREAAHWLLARDPQLTAAALQHLADPDQRRMCGGRVVRGLRAGEVVRRCGRQAGGLRRPTRSAALLDIA